MMMISSKVCSLNIERRAQQGFILILKFTLNRLFTLKKSKVCQLLLALQINLTFVETVEFFGRRV